MGAGPSFNLDQSAPFPEVTACLLLAQRFSHDHCLKDPIRSIIVLDESGAEIHRETVEQNG
jgi:hypothetical protein